MAEQTETAPPQISVGRIVISAVTQAARAILTGLIPITLIALFGWASAGSGSGNTGDALRGATLLWLSAHHVSLDLSFATTQAVGSFSLLPIGLLIIPILTLRGSGLRLAREVKGARMDVLVLATLMLGFAYAVIVTAVALVVDTSAVRPRFLEAFGFGLVLALLAGGSRIVRFSWSDRALRLLRYLRAVTLLLVVPASVLVLTSLVLNFDQVLDIIAVLRLGVVSMVFVVIIALVYLPNAVLWAIAYSSGIGFGFGTGSLLSPWQSTLEAVPTFPLFAALPASPPDWAPILPLLVLLAMIVVSAAIYRSTDDVLGDAVRLLGAVAILALVATWLSGGSLIGGGLGSVGPSLWKFPLAMLGYAAVGYLLGAGVPALARRIRN